MSTITISEIVRLCGGARAIVEAPGSLVATPEAVYKWATLGIPDRHWPVLIGLAGGIDKLSPAQIYAENCRIRKVDPEGRVPLNSVRTAAVAAE